MLEMLEKGETPPNIRTDIVDEPPNPAAVPSSARMKPKAKPWERAAAPTSAAAFPALAPSGSSGKTCLTIRCYAHCVRNILACGQLPHVHGAKVKPWERRHCCCACFGRTIPCAGT